MMSAEEVRKCQEEIENKLSIDEIDLEKIQKEILEAIVEDSNVTSVCIFIGRLSIVAKLKSLGFGVDDRIGYGRGLLYIVSWEGENRLGADEILHQTKQHKPEIVKFCSC